MSSNSLSPSPQTSPLNLLILIITFLSLISLSTSFTLLSPPSTVSFMTTKHLPTRLSSASKPHAATTYTVKPIKTLSGVVTLPGSKSLSNRCLLLASLSPTPTIVSNLLQSDDIRYMLEALDMLGVKVEKIDETTVEVHGYGSALPLPKNNDDVTLFLGNAGTAMRPLAAALPFSSSLLKGDRKIILDGVERMRERPIADLIEGLNQLGAKVTCVSETGCPPVVISNPGDNVNIGGVANISGKMSSQFLSALLMAGVLSEHDDGVRINIKDELISAPYVNLTIDLMRKFGINVVVEGDITKKPSFVIPKSAKYKSPGTILVEGDASSASYFLAGAAITGGRVTVVGCGSESVQGDVKFADVMEKMGATVEWGEDSITLYRDPKNKLKGGDFDCGDIPDAAMTIAVCALFADGPTTIRNVYSWRLKETERMKAIVAECTKLGATVEEFRDYCIIHPPANGVNDKVLIETYDDHRMAMTFALAACGGVEVVINDPGCTAKTFPTYFEVLESVVEHGDKRKMKEKEIN